MDSPARRAGCGRAARGSLSRSAQSPPRTPSRLGSGDVAAVVVVAAADAQRVSCARIRQKATLPRPPARPSGRYDETGSAALLHEYVPVA